jgi:hypothetical protein
LSRPYASIYPYGNKTDESVRKTPIEQEQINQLIQK